MAPDIEFIEAMQVLSLQSGDTVVLKTDHSLTREQMVMIETMFSDRLGVPVMVLTGGLDIGVLRQAA